MTVDVIYVMGVSGCGKSTVGQLLAERINWHFRDGDSLHPQSNIDKMSQGIPLVDEDRFPWLRAIRDYAREHRPCVVACSSLRQSYRQILSDSLNTRFLLINIERSVLLDRMRSRTGHFMPSSLLDSQLATLEMPSEQESNVKIVECSSITPEEIVTEALRVLDL